MSRMTNLFSSDLFKGCMIALLIIGLAVALLIAPMWFYADQVEQGTANGAVLLLVLVGLAILDAIGFDAIRVFLSMIYGIPVFFLLMYLVYKAIEVFKTSVN